MAGMKLHAEYELIENAARNIRNTLDSYRGTFNIINSVMDLLGNSFIGRAAKMLMNYWTGMGVSHANSAMNHVTELISKLQRIRQVLEANDEACAAIFDQSEV